MTEACDACLRRAWLLAALAGHVQRSHERFGAPDSLLAVSDAELIAALAGRRRAQIATAMDRFDPDAARRRAETAGTAAICAHAPGYPAALRALPDAPATLHLAGAGGLPGTDDPVAAVVGARRATAYGIEVARALGRGLAAAGVTVVSGMALGVDSAAHEGALAAGGPTIAVLAGGADIPYPASKRSLHARVMRAGTALSEFPPGFRPHRWCFPARNRLIAALAGATVVVEAAARSGALITARIARDLGRDVAAVPGPITSTRARGTNDLLFDGAHVVRRTEDVLDLLFGVGAAPARPDPRDRLEPRLRRVLEDVCAGRDCVSALAATREEAEAAMVALSELELLGHLRLGPGGRYVPLL